MYALLLLAHDTGADHVLDDSGLDHVIGGGIVAFALVAVIAFLALRSR